MFEEKTSQTGSASPAIQVTMAFCQKEDHPYNFSFHKRNGSITINDGTTTISSPAANNPFEGLLKNQVIKFGGGTLDGEQRQVVEFNNTVDPHVLTVSGSPFTATDAADEIWAFPILYQLPYKSGQLEVTPNFDNEANHNFNPELHPGKGLKTGIEASLSIENSLTINPILQYFLKGVLSNNSWLPKIEQVLTISLSLEPDTPDKNMITCAADGWANDIVPGQVIKITGLVTNSVLNGCPLRVLDKDTGMPGAHRLQVIGPRIFENEADVEVTVTRLRCIKDGTDLVTFQCAENDPNLELYRNVDWATISGMSISGDVENAVTVSWTMGPGRVRQNMASDGIEAYPYYSGLESIDPGQALAGAMMTMAISEYGGQNEEVISVTTNGIEISDRFSLERQTPSGEGAYNPRNTSGYFPSNAIIGRHNITVNLELLLNQNTTKYLRIAENECLVGMLFSFTEPVGCNSQKVQRLLVSIPSILLTETQPSGAEENESRKMSAQGVSSGSRFVDQDGVEHKWLCWFCIDDNVTSEMDLAF